MISFQLFIFLHCLLGFGNSVLLSQKRSRYCMVEVLFAVIFHGIEKPGQVMINNKSSFVAVGIKCIFSLFRGKVCSRSF